MRRLKNHDIWSHDKQSVFNSIKQREYTCIVLKWTLLRMQIGDKRSCWQNMMCRRLQISFNFIRRVQLQFGCYAAKIWFYRTTHQSTGCIDSFAITLSPVNFELHRFHIEQRRNMLIFIFPACFQFEIPVIGDFMVYHLSHIHIGQKLQIIPSHFQIHRHHALENTIILESSFPNGGSCCLHIRFHFTMILFRQIPMLRLIPCTCKQMERWQNERVNCIPYHLGFPQPFLDCKHQDLYSISGKYRIFGHCDCHLQSTEIILPRNRHPVDRAVI